MCFSAAASFALSAALVPTGLYTISRVRSTAPQWVPFAAFPLAFGMQQAAEGVVWLGLLNDNPALTHGSARVFIFFSHFFWPAFVPLAVRAIETDPRRKRLIASLSVVGIAFGLTLFLPILVSPDLLQVEMVEHSILYRTSTHHGPDLTDHILRLLYAALVVGALWLSSDPAIRLFGTFVAGSLLLTWVAFDYAFVSVWCFFAAMLSVDIAIILLGREGPVAARAR
jgi:hypothetical protein